MHWPLPSFPICRREEDRSSGHVCIRPALRARLPYLPSPRKRTPLHAEALGTPDLVPQGGERTFTQQPYILLNPLSLTP